MRATSARFYCWLARALGRRRAVAVLFGIIHIGQGMILLHDPGAFVPDDAVFFTTFPVPLRVGAWVVTGLLTMLFAFFERAERWAWVTVIVMPAERFLGHTWSLIEWIVPGNPRGSEWAAAYMMFWGGLVAILLLLAGWRDDVPERLEHSSEGR